ncbi:MAG: prepilin-type N-terminal cleavage/methylation domain-containing protein [Planctomycetes bacterium]|nr:prepilin-type N-terminal cleavage/methylation domain-containing protein [Planctomycetota bacterium]
MRKRTGFTLIELLVVIAHHCRSHGHPHAGFATGAQAGTGGGLSRPSETVEPDMDHVFRR